MFQFKPVVEQTTVLLRMYLFWVFDLFSNIFQGNKR
jgi:hypothetical protein